MASHVWEMSIEQRESIIKAAFEAKQNSYSPYSKFRVGAALLAADGTIFKGANIENASYGGTICAERTAIVKAVSEGNKSFIALAVVTDVPSSISPCGMCRQVIREFCAVDMPILLVPGDYPKGLGDESEGKPGVTAGGVRETSIGELLPDSFGPEHLELPRTGTGGASGGGGT
ncbi:cytidine deaminase [Mycena rosella]|uniref:Cytidine deaminase n=1 Tax=Mycena rosella TaxID=1033263 RepID=A0AAD7GNG8_MYCRO|nr:cytidine deaminase [Mycena rosella]